tara:strand:- start:14848 stop:15441 length:594 start_codon:yes stop_codon:yes gene_type:complete
LGVLNVGFFGGSFDPPHNGHEEIANLSVGFLGLDVLYVCPTGGIIGDKQLASSSYEKRLQMAKSAFSKTEKTKVVDWERGEEASYTYNTVNELVKREKTSVNVFVIMGMDSFLNIDSWREYEKLFLLANIVAFPRAGISKSSIKNFISELKQANVSLEKVIFATNNIVNVSSSEVRNKRVIKNKHVSPAVLDIYLKD